MKTTKATRDPTPRGPEATAPIVLPDALAFDPLGVAHHPESLRWRPPSCPLRYRFVDDTELFTGPLRMIPTGGIIRRGEATMLPGKRGYHGVLRNGDIEIAHVSQGIRNPGNVQPAGTLADARLTTDGRSWTERDGPAALWSAYGSFNGLVEFWPALPPEATIGATGTWTVVLHRRGDGTRVEAERGQLTLPEGAEIPTPKPTSVHATVELASWVSVRGQPAAVLVSHRTRAGEEQPPGFPSPLAYQSEVHGRFVVLATGRLLYAEVDRTLRTEGDHPALNQRHETRARIGLVQACDGPVVDLPPVPAPSTEEFALRELDAFRLAVTNDDANAATRLLSSALRDAHGSGAIFEALRAHVELHGPGSLGVFQIYDGLRRDGDRIVIETTGFSRHFLDGTNLTLRYAAEIHGDRVEIVSIEATQQYVEDGRSLLRVTPARLESWVPPRGKPLKAE